MEVNFIMFSKKVLKTILTFLLVIACAAVSPAQTSQAAEKSYTDNDLKYMAAIIYCEAGNQCYAGKIAVGCVVMNRVKSSSFPNTVLKVIKQRGQFSPVRQGKFARETKNVERGKYSSGARRECMKAAQEVLEGQRAVFATAFSLDIMTRSLCSSRILSIFMRVNSP